MSEETTSLASSPKKQRKTLWIFTLILLLSALLWICYWFFYLQYHEYTNDAYANGNLVNVNSAVSGSVVAFFADDTDLVIEGQLLAVLDDTNYIAAYEKELWTLNDVVLKVKGLYDTVLARQTNVENKKARKEKVEYDYKNRSNLVSSKAISNEDFVHSQTDLLLADLDLKQAEFELKVAQDSVGNFSIREHPMIEQQKRSVRKAFYDLQHCHIYAPATGNVAKRAIEVGQWVTPNTNLMAIIPKEGFWVDANFKETQLTYMRIGQPATVWFDLYGSKVSFEGKVLGIASGTGSVFSLIPPQNATGNWIKIVQRLPVRISLNPEHFQRYPPRLGISAEVDVDISNDSLPMLAEVPPSKPVAITTVFSLPLEQLEKKMDQMINTLLEEGRVSLEYGDLSPLSDNATCRVALSGRDKSRIRKRRQVAALQMTPSFKSNFSNALFLQT